MIVETEKDHRLMLFKKGLYYLTREITPEFLEEKYQNREDWKIGWTFCDWDNHDDFKMNIRLILDFESFNREEEKEKILLEEEQKRIDDWTGAVLALKLLNDEKERTINLIDSKISDLEDEFNDYHPEKENDIIVAKLCVLKELKEELT